MMRRTRGRDLMLLAGVLPGVLFPLFLAVHAHQVNGRNGFPLDDSWIHLTYARTLHDAHSFAYYPGAARTQGSTSPLYTMLLALGFSFTRNEKILSYVLGLLFQLGFLAVFTLWARAVFSEIGGRARTAIAAIAAAVLLGLDSRIGILAVSGMETSLFLFLLSLVFWAERRDSPGILGLAAGLLVWVRPDGLILTAVLLVTRVLRRIRPPEPGGDRSPLLRNPLLRNPLFRMLLPFALLLLAYAVFNLVNGGAILPNTLNAKATYYRGNSRMVFLFQDVREVFLTGAWIILTPLALARIVVTVVQWARRRPSPLLLEAGWSLALPLAYFLLLPFGHRFGRYLVPALPAVLLLGLRGLLDFTAMLQTGSARAGGSPKSRQARGSRDAETRPLPTKASRSGRSAPARSAGPATEALASGPMLLAGVVLVGALLLQIRSAAAGVPEYADYCAYHYTRHERTGLWLAGNTPPDAVIATHDVGAIAYDSHRKVVDMVGVVLPEVVPHIKKPDYLAFLEQLFAREKVTHLAVLRNWCEVVNVDPIFTADPRPEVMEVFPWIPGKTHLMPREASDMNRLAADQLRASNPAGALALLERSLAVDPGSSRTWLLVGAAREVQNQLPGAEEAYAQVLRLFPESADGALHLAAVLARQGRREEALPVIRGLVERRPDFPGAAELLQRLSQDSRATTP